MPIKTIRYSLPLICVLFVFLIAACLPGKIGRENQELTPTSSKINPDFSSDPTITNLSTDTVSSTPTPNENINIWFAPYLPDRFEKSIQLPTTWKIVDDPSTANISVDIASSENTSIWVYVLVAPFPTITDGVTFSALQDSWRYGPAGRFEVKRLLIDQSTYDIFKIVWGEPNSSFITVVPNEDLLELCWNDSSSWALIPFEQLNSRWKVLTIDGASPIHYEFNKNDYPLSIPISINYDYQSSIKQKVLADAIFPSSNFDPDRMTTLVLTGVTALVRATAAMMEIKGVNYPALDIVDLLRNADITHISNEVSFAQNCPTPNGNDENLKFCSKSEYIKLLEFIGTDIVELDGDHFQDWGIDAIRYTLDLYKQYGWKTYGGGANIDEAQQPLLIEHNGNRLAFIGCNAKLPGYAQASKTQPGAAHCDQEWLLPEIENLRKEGYLPIVTYQHEEYYSYFPLPQYQSDFLDASNAGAVIVSGSQAHQPQSMEFNDDSFIHYGLGNLFFDQYYEGFPMRQAFIDRHIFYDGQYISTELLTIMFVDYARSRPMTLDERQDLLQTVFTTFKSE